MGIELAVELQRAETERRTGVLCVGDGAFRFTDGAITSADCHRTPGLDRLVVEAGVATAAAWQRASAGDADEVLSLPQLETIALLAVFDAAFFLLASPGIPEFQPAPPHWLAPVCRIPARTLVHECARRSRVPAGPWPSELVDRAPVVPVHRIRRHRVVLTGNQAEVLAAADARRSIAGIAENLGRTTYGCLVAVRELTAAGLLERPIPAQVEPITARVVRAPVRPEPALAGAAAPGQLPRRTARTGIPQEMPALAPQAAPVAVPERWDTVDKDLLIRLRKALEELD
ncbi:hypothetical protein [Nocardia sp. NPDC048505]|uniref:hypothetical protein n=1 Tax=unclassified Nocardia TaxID=2637762 RepID=UPI0033CC8B5B